MRIEKTKDGTIFKMESIDDYLQDTTAKCGDGKFLTGMISKKEDGIDVKYCIKTHAIDEVCSYLSINTGYQKCTYYSHANK